MEHHQKRLQDYRWLRRFQCELCHNSEMSVEQIETRYVKKRLREHLSMTPDKKYFYKELAPARIKTDLGAVEKVVDLLQNAFSIIPALGEKECDFTSMSTGWCYSSFRSTQSLASS